MPTTFLCAWDAGALALLSMSWRAIVVSDAETTRRRCALEDPGRTSVYVITLVIAAVSLAAAVVLARQSKAAHSSTHDTLVVMSTVAVLLSWALTHTMLTLRYAHLFYRDDEDGPGIGLMFPTSAERGAIGGTAKGSAVAEGGVLDGDAPDYLDFAYFAFTIGMCFQTSDVTVTTRVFRRTVLAHASVSFLYNTVVVAFTLSLVFGSVG